ncbi:MAG: hypothetical protein HRF40_04235 [Nitrososphaera sp.]
MFEPTSRYFSVEDASIETKDGGKVTYKKRRFVPDWSEMALLHELRVNDGDRLDSIAARVVGDPEQFWRICDANNIMHPLELTNEPGKSIRIARPWG